MTTNTPTLSSQLDRRSFMKAAAGAGGLALLSAQFAWGQAAAPLLRVRTRTIEVNKRAATVFKIERTSGGAGIVGREGDRFRGAVLNETGAPLQLHWHGQVRASNGQDRSRSGGGALAAGQSDVHDFELTPGTHWMHSHGLTEQQLLAAPMITLEKNGGDVQEVVILLHDFAFRSPQEILAELGGSDVHAGHGPSAPGMRMGGTGPRGHMSHGGMQRHPDGHGPGHMMGMTHANDVRYDAYLANDRTLDDPEVVRVEKGGRVRLRIINGATATGFFITTPGLESQLVAVDGSACRPLAGTSYPLAQGQRIDLMVEMPKGGGAFPVLAQVEDAQFLTGIVLGSPGATIAKLARESDLKAPLLDLALDSRLAASQSLTAKRPDKHFMVMLGEEPGYRWTINGAIHGEHEAFTVRQGDRVEMTFMNPTSMMHPMHLHGHHFQVVGIGGGRRFAGPVRDTVIVPAHMPVTIAFDAGLKGSWFLHCHHLYHMATGMMTELRVT